MIIVSRCILALFLWVSLMSNAMTSIKQASFLTVDELDRLIKQVEPGAFLVSSAVLRRVIKYDRELRGLSLLVPHRKGYVIERGALLDCVAIEEMELARGTELPQHVFLLVRPDADRLAKCTVEHALVEHWRILFHLRIDHVMQQKLQTRSLTSASIRQRICRLGMIEFAEITAVLKQENLLLPPESVETVYIEFVAVYLTLRRFDPALVARFFPALRDLGAVDALLAEDIDAEAIYHATRLSGAPLASDKGTKKETETSLPGSFSAEAEPSPLCNRLKTALGLSDADAERWSKALRPLEVQSAPGSSCQEARLLYDLQSVCIDSEQGINTVDLMGWILSLGQLPVKRPIPGQQEVAILRHLRSALDRLRLVRLTDAERQCLTRLLTGVLEHRENLLRERVRSVIAASMDEVGLKASNVAEQVARGKLIEELLDRVVEFGHFNIGNLRDAISRNQLKLPDLKSPVEFVMGDPLIRLNRLLAVRLDGVYRRGEIYLRMLHRLSSLGFGTWLGRLVVLFLILPFGLAFFTMITPGIAIEEGEKLTKWVGQLIGLIEKPPELPRHRETHHFPIPNWWGVAALGVFFVLLFHVGQFRSLVFYGADKAGRGLQTVFIYGPVWLFNLPILQAILHNRYWRLFRWYVFWPGVMAATGGLTVWACGLETSVIISVAAGCLVLGIVVLNTHLGRDIEEAVTDWLLRFWVWLTLDFVPGLLHLIMDISRWCLEAVEQMLYTVNEWLRYRSGENRAVVIVKAVLGLVWFWVTYVIRFAINLLVEPQINPIKHFPVVTVSHKICLPMIPTLAQFLRDTFAIPRPTTTATGIIFGIPGIFGFMVWELKENWKLYTSNRASTLSPVLIGSHGETMLRLLRPGFHSGTLPKLFKKLRRAERSGQEGTIRKVLASLHHVEESLAHFVERELVSLLRRNKDWSGLDLDLKHVRLATNRVMVELSCKALGEQPLVFTFDEQNGWLLAGVLEAGWLLQLTTDQRQALAAALAGLYKMAGVHLTYEQLGASLPPTLFAFDITRDGLIVCTADGNHDALYDLGAGAEVSPTSLNGSLPAGMPVLNATRLLFANVPVTWQDWVHTWEGNHVNGELRQAVGRLLPAGKK